MKKASYNPKRGSVRIERETGNILTLSYNTDSYKYRWEQFDPKSRKHQVGSGTLKDLITRMEIQNDEYLYFNEHI